MKKKLTKADILILAGLLIGSIAFMGYVKLVLTQETSHNPVPFTQDEIKQLSNNDLKAVVVYPILTQYAYQKNGFYDYYSHKCNTCTTVSLYPMVLNATYNTGKSGFTNLITLSYPFITDITIDKNPNILNDYDEVILLHNEYMTKKEFNAIVNHKHVVYLYPNAMYAEVSVDYTKKTMTLVKGHGYPDSDIKNGFGYVTTSQWEYDTKCDNFKWIERPNGIGLTCYPEYLLTYDRGPFTTILEYPEKVPNLLPMNTTKSDINMPFCYHNGTCTTAPRDYTVP